MSEVVHDAACPNRGVWMVYCPYCRILKRIRAEYVNPDCVWGQGTCVPGCPSCHRMDELVSERSAGFEEGKQAERQRRLGTFEAASWFADLWYNRGAIDALRSALRELKRLGPKPGAHAEHYIAAVQGLIDARKDTSGLDDG